MLTAPLVCATDEEEIAQQASAGSLAIPPAEEMVMLVNKFRAENGLPPVKVSPNLGQAAVDFAGRMANRNFFGHLDPDAGCSTPWQRAEAAGYLNWTNYAENIAAGFATAASAVEGFKASPSHRATMLNPAFREIGVGYMYDGTDASNVRQEGSCPYSRTGGPYRYYWTQEFGSRYSGSGYTPLLPVVINGEAPSTDQRRVNLYIYGGAHGQPVWARQMRFSEDGASWTPYEPWAPNRAFDLAPGSGFKTVYVQLTDGSTTQTVSDMIYLHDANSPGPAMAPRAFIPIAVR